MSFPEVPIGMESYASPHDYYIAQNMQNMPPQGVQLPPISMEHMGMGSPRGRGSFMGSPRHHQYPHSLQQQAYMNHYYNNNNNNNDRAYPRRQRSKSEMGTKHKFVSPRGNNDNNNNGSAPDKKSPRWPQVIGISFMD